MADRLRGFAGPLSSGIQSFVRTEVGKIVQSQAFADAWVQANRVAHQALVKALTGQGDGAVTVADDTVSVDLAPFIETVKQRLVASGFGLAARIPEVNASFVLFDVKNLTRAQAAFNLLNTLGIWLPIIAVVMLGVGVWVGQGPPSCPGRCRHRGRGGHAGARPVPGGIPDRLPGRRPGRGAAP